MSQIHMDVAIVGNELCGIAAAAQLAHRGLRVVLIDDGHTDVHPLGGFSVPVAPSIWQLPSAGMNADLIAQLGLKHDISQAFSENAELAIISDPHLRCAFPPHSKERTTEFSRIFGEEHGRVTSDYLSQYVQPPRDSLFEESARLLDKGLFNQLKAKKRIQKADDSIDPSAQSPETAVLDSSPLRPMIEHWARFELPLLEYSPHGFMFETIAHRFKTGVTNESIDGLTPRCKLGQLFKRVIAGHGGEILPGAQVVSVETRGSKIARLQTDGENDFVADVVIDATPDSSFLEHFPDSRALTKTRNMEKAIANSGGAAIRRWILPKARLPRGLGPCTLIYSEQEKEINCPIVLSVFKNLQPSASEERKKGQRATNNDYVGVIAASRTPVNVDAPSFSSYIEAVVHEVMPFSLQYAKASDDIVGQRAWNALPSYTAQDGAHTLLRGRSPRTGFQNLYRAGRDIAPSMGLAGELSTARSICEGIATKLLPSK